MKNISSIVSSSIGNILEWYDFGLFAVFSPLFSHLFFPADNPNVALMTTFGIFAVGFLCRPIGALIFGYLGDKTGRARTIRLSILLISIPTLLIGCLPSYQQIGILAPVLLTVIRILQGISIGGEYSGNLIYIAETAPDRYRATFTSIANMGTNIGFLLATLVGMITTTFFRAHDLQLWGWRIPYLVSGLFCLIIFIFRLRLKETIIFDCLRQKKMLARNPIMTVFNHNLPQLLRTLGLVCMGSTFYYFCFVYLPIFMRQSLQFSIHPISIIMSLLISLMIVLVPGAGWICDRIGRRKMLLFNATVVSLSVIPGFYFLQFDNVVLLVLVLLLFIMASSSEQATTSIAIVENFPPQARYTGLSLGYNLGNGLLGGTVPVVCEWLITYTHFSLAPAFYIAFCAGITGLVAFFFVPETRGESLSKMD